MKAVAVHEIRRAIETKKDGDPRFEVIAPGSQFEAKSDEMKELIEAGAAREFNKSDEGAPVHESKAEAKAGGAKTDMNKVQLLDGKKPDNNPLS